MYALLTRSHLASVRSKWLDIGQIFFCVFMDRDKVEVRGVACQRTCRPGPTNFWFDHSTACNKLCVVGLS